jgi:thiol-disulfide isomerase/thioredoxin
MLLESEMRLLIAMFLIPLAGCDSASKPAEQVQPARPVVGKPGGVRADIGLESASGMRATLSYRFAGNAAPKAVFSGTDGRDVTLADFAGRPLLVNIWATWCAPCKAEMPTLDALAVLEEGQVSVIAVSQDLQGRKPVRAFFEAASITNLEPFTDPDNAILTSLGNNIALPTTILYDSDGYEIWRVMGGVEWDDAEMAKLLNEAG